MENASKALLMAGGVLIALIVIGLVVMAFNGISNYYQQQETQKAVGQSVDFNIQFEAYNRNVVYGSEIYSLANLLVDYRKKEADDETKGYKPIKIWVKINKDIGIDFIENEYKNKYSNLRKNTTNVNGVEAGDIQDDLKQLEKDVEEKARKTETVQNRKIRLDALYSLSNDEFFQRTNQKKSERTGIAGKVYSYEQLKNFLTEFKRKTFKCTKVNYDNNNGRITEMYYVDKT